MTDRDPDLSNLLKSWRHEPPPASRFNSVVWARIETVRDTPWAAVAGLAGRLGIPAQYFRWALPLGASVVLALAAAAGAGAGALHSTLTKNERMATAYVQKIDPLQMAGDQHQ